jgi:enamine deaminase RidA (YjgF/YER057c/UK114 family)
MDEVMEQVLELGGELPGLGRIIIGAKHGRYSRAIYKVNIIEIAGTTATDADGNVTSPNDAYQPTRQIILKAEQALQELDTDLTCIIRTRIYTTDISLWEEIGRAHGEFFGAIRPVATMVEVSSLIDPHMLVEMEFSGVAGK